MAQKSLLPPGWEIPAEIRQRLGDGVGRQRLMQAEGHLLLVLHKPPQLDEQGRVGRFFWRKPSGQWQGCEPAGKSITLGSHLAEFQDVLQRLDRAEEAASSARDYFDLMSHLGPLQRTARNLHLVLQEAREKAPGDRELINARDRAYELERSFELLHTDSQNGLNFAVARQAESQAASSHRMAVSAHRLNLLAAFFFPLATASAVLGANLQHGFETQEAPLPFYLLLGGGLLSGALLALYVSATRPSS